MCVIVITCEVLQPWYVWYVRVGVVSERQTQRWRRQKQRYGATMWKRLEEINGLNKLNATSYYPEQTKTESKVSVFWQPDESEDVTSHVVVSSLASVVTTGFTFSTTVLNWYETVKTRVNLNVLFVKTPLNQMFSHDDNYGLLGLGDVTAAGGLTRMWGRMLWLWQ